MQKAFFRTTKGETLVSVVLGVAILSFLVAGIASVLYTSYDSEDNYDRTNALLLLQSNATSILRNVDTSAVREKETFVIYRDTSAQRFVIFTGATDVEKYRYVDKNGNYVSNTGSHIGPLYSLYFFVDKNESSFGKKNQIIKAGLKELVWR